MNPSIIKVVGLSAGGKSTLVRRLRQAGYDARPVSQEHSNVPALWQQFDQTAVLIYLDIDLETQRSRRPDVTWDEATLLTERKRLAHAYEHADLKINTAGLAAEDVLKVALAFLQNQRIRHADEPLPPLASTGSALVPAPESEVTSVWIGEKKRNRKKRRNKAGVAAKD